MLVGGYSGHVDGKLREARMKHPKEITVDDRGNIYVADTTNMAIRKISDSGKVTVGDHFCLFTGVCLRIVSIYVLENKKSL